MSASDAYPRDTYTSSSAGYATPLSITWVLYGNHGRKLHAVRAWLSPYVSRLSEREALLACNRSGLVYDADSWTTKRLPRCKRCEALYDRAVAA